MYHEAMAVGTRRLYMSQQDTFQLRFEAVIQGARLILEQKPFAESARVIFDHCRRMTGAVSGYVALLSADGSENEVLFLEPGGLPCSVDPGLPMPIRGLRASAYYTQKVVYDNDFMHSRWARYMPEGHAALRNVMFAPLALEDRTVGIVGLANKPTDFTDEDADIARVFGDLAAIALQNSRNVEKITEHAEKLERAMAEIRTLQGIIPICMYCKEIRDDEGYWMQLERYLSEHSHAQFSHSICDKCLEKYHPELKDS